VQAATAIHGRQSPPKADLAALFVCLTIKARFLPMPRMELRLSSGQETPIKYLNPVDLVKRWCVSRIDLLNEVDKLRDDNQRLRVKVAALQHAKDVAERQAEERRREKAVLRTRLAAQKKVSDQDRLIADQLNAKITELWAENDELRRARKQR